MWGSDWQLACRCDSGSDDKVTIFLFGLLVVPCPATCLWTWHWTPTLLSGNLSIYLSIFYTSLIQFRFVGGLEPIPAAIGREAGYTLERSPVNYSINRETNNYAYSERRMSERIINYPVMHVYVCMSMYRHTYISISKCIFICVWVHSLYYSLLLL